MNDNYVSDSYLSARRRFCDAVEKSGGELIKHELPGYTGPDGSPLSVDVGLVGDIDAPGAALIVSGTHGQEGYAGSAAQLAVLEQASTGDVPANIRLVLVHAINPWGFANGSRTNEDNVDLNRNFLNWENGARTSELYNEMHEILTLTELTEKALDSAWPRIGALMEKYGPGPVSDAMAGGQYIYPEGMNYGGRGPVWSNTLLQSVVKEFAAPARRAALIDWHTGIGEFGKPFFFCFHDRDSEAYARACDWWGRENVETSDVGGGMPPPNYQGLLFRGVEEALCGTPFTGTVIEVGTYPLPEMAKALMIDQYLKFGAPADPDVAERWRAWMHERFCPAGAEWAGAVKDIANRHQGEMLAGLSKWAESD